jgi:rod shape determining protein RodA
MHKTSTWRKFDFVLLGVLVVLVVLGVAMIRSANLGTPDLADLWRKQATYAIVGLALFVLAAIVPYSWYRHVWWLGYALALGLLILVLLVGESEIGDVRRWFYIGTFRMQPSFPAMLLHVVAMSALLDYRRRKERRLEMETDIVQDCPGLGLYLLSGLMTLALGALIFLEPDLSTAVVFLTVWAAVSFVSGVRLLYLIGTGALGLGALVPLWRVMADYQRDRILLFLSPERDPEKLFTLRQALISIGSGGLWGQGYAVGSQSQLHFLRVRHTDFVFSVVGEELGFIGTVLILVLFTLLAWRLFRAALLAPDRLGRLLVIGAGAVIFFPLVVNVGMNLGVLPVTGLPLPFISYGGSALLTYMTALGLSEGVALRRK